MSEHDEQVEIFKWRDEQLTNHPELALLVAYPAGGLRDKATARRMKAEGQAKDFPDLALFVARGGYHGLLVELKTEIGILRHDQRAWLAQLEEAGYMAVYCRGHEEAQSVILGYLCLKPS